MPYSKHKGMKIYEEVQGPQNAYLTLPRKYNHTSCPVLGMFCFNLWPWRRGILGEMCHVSPQYSETDSAVVRKINHNCFLTDSVRFITQ